MTAKLRRLTLQRFRSVRGATVEFDNPTFLVGQNGAGKSNIVAVAIHFRVHRQSTPSVVSAHCRCRKPSTVLRACSRTRCFIAPLPLDERWSLPHRLAWWRCLASWLVCSDA